MLKTVIKFHDNLVMVFDEKGELIPEYQGQYEDVKESILQNATPNTVFGYQRDSEPELHKIASEEW